MHGKIGKVCAIHQPNFFPWLGYFEKIRRADYFVFLDCVDYPKSGNSMGSWVNRVRIAINGQRVWIRIPVVREPGPQPIATVRIDRSSAWRQDLLRTLDINYRKAPHFSDAMPLLEELLRYECDFVADFNMNAIRRISDVLGLTCSFIRQTELDTASSSTELLVEIIRKVGAQTYLCGDGAAEYQNDAMFGQYGLGLRRLNFMQRPYGGRGTFIPGLSAIDFLMKCKPESFLTTISTEGESCAVSSAATDGPKP